MDAAEGGIFFCKFGFAVPFMVLLSWYDYVNKGRTPGKTEEFIMKESKHNNAAVAARVLFEGLYIGSLLFTLVWAACLG